MATRLELDAKFVEILGTSEEEIKRVYFQPPASVQMKYPAIRYSLSDIDIDYANNLIYKQKLKYEIIVIDKDPESDIFLKVSALPYCRFVRHYTADNLNHYVFEIYY